MNRTNTRSSLLLLLALAWIIGVSLSSRAASLVVTNLADGGPGSLRDAVAIANTNADPDVITFAPSLSGQNISLLQVGGLVLSNVVTIDASGLVEGIGLINLDTSAGVNHRLFEVLPNSVVELNNLRMMGGVADQPVGDHINGGGILATGPGTLTLNDCTLSLNYALRQGGAIFVGGTGLALTLNRCVITRNIAQRGGGIYVGPGAGTTLFNECVISGNGATLEGGGANGRMTISNSTIHDNFARWRGGGIFGLNGLRLHNSTLFGNSAPNGAALFLNIANSASGNNSTISGNHAVIEGGGIFVLGGGMPLTNSIVAGNTAPNNPNINFATATPNNLINGDPHLASPGNYGGPTMTMPPLAGSPAIDAGNDSVTNSLAADQRGFPRLAGAHVDIGAVESQVANTANAPVLTLAFASSPDTDFTVLATTNVALPAGQWSILGPATENPPGQYRFTDVFAPDYSRRFYQVTSP